MPVMSKRKKSTTNDLKINIFDTVKQRLHTSSVPDSLPCRDNEFNDIYNFLDSKLKEGVGG